MKTLLLVAGVSVAVRLMAWGYLERQVAADPDRQYVIAGDADGYWDLGTDIALGRPYAVHEPPRRVMRTPGVPILIAGAVSVFGESRTAARGVLAIVSAAAPVCVWLLASVYLKPRPAAAAGLTAALSPLAVGLSPTLLSDGPFATGLAFLCWRTAVLLDRPTTGRAVFAGLLAGAAALVRPAILPAIWILLPVIWLRCGWRSAVAFAVAAAVAISPWTVRNALTTGVATPTTLWTGPTLYDSFRPGSDGGSDMRFFDEDAELRRDMTEAEVNRWYSQRTVARVRDDPATAAKLALLKQQRFWSVWPRSDESGPWAFRMASAVWSVCVLVLGGVGGWRLRRSWPTLCTCLGPLAYFAALHLVFVGSMRYRMPAELPLCVLAAASVVPGCRITRGQSPSNSSSGSDSRNVAVS